MKSKVVDQEVIICRFGSAFSTLTVVLLERRVYNEIQEKMKALDTKGSLVTPKITVGERVCFKSNIGIWTRARIAAVRESGTAGPVTVDIVIEDSLETLKRVDGRALVASPAALRKLRNADLYFIEGLEPYKYVIGPKGSEAVGAQASANALNEQWTRTPAGTRLLRITPLSMPNIASKTRMQVAGVSITQNLSLHAYIADILSDHVIPGPVFEAIRRSKHPGFRSRNGPSLLCPHVSEEEVCEVLFTRKTSERTLEVGLRLSTYLDSHLFERMLKQRAPLPPRVLSGPVTVSISRDGYFMQRGVLLECGRILGSDTLESFEPDSVEIRLLPIALCDVLPHLGLLIDWDLSVRSRTPSPGDLIVVKNLKEDRGTLFHFNFEDVSFLGEFERGCQEMRQSMQEWPLRDVRHRYLRFALHNNPENPTVLNYHPRRLEGNPAPPRKQMKEKSKKIDIVASKALQPALAEWYGLSSELRDVFQNLLSSSSDPPLEALLVQYGEAIHIQDL